MDQAAKGSSALDAGDFPAAISCYTNAISANPEAVDYYIKRSTAYTRLSPPDHASAYQDSEIAVLLATKRGKRELIAQSQLRRAIALFGLERWADAKRCLEWAQKLNDKEKTLPMWNMKVENKLKGLPEGDDRSTPTVQENPEVSVPKPGAKISDNTKKSDDHHGTNGNSSTIQTASTATEPPQLTASKIRHDWYQSHDSVTVTVFAKGVPKDKATININERSVEVSFPLTDASDFDLSFDPLFSNIDPAASSFKILSTKIEFQLKKASPGVKWGNLEGSGPVQSDQPVSNNSADTTVKRAVLAEDTANAAPSYPTSSKSGPKNWDKVASDLTKKPKKEGETSEDGNDQVTLEEDEDDADPVNGFFKKLFKDADPDTRRAMMKSYQESSGTALSTNWAEVGKGPVETTPPEGMEARKW